MRLIGMLDSPYVRRTAISLRMMGLDFELSQLSVFRNFDEFKAISPVVKAPSLVTDSGQVLMESTLILEYAERLAPSKSLMPADAAEYVKTQHLIGFALAANEKTVQMVYEKSQRPTEKYHQPWFDRVSGQLQRAYGELERETPAGWFGANKPNQADITVAVAWRFTQSRFPEVVTSAVHPKLAAHSARAEVLPPFAELNF
ncbi:MAG TPA: glutathione S-transferase [Rhizomicrobium sp.]|nr:glutathione S-transferase [Rhizomicrobium sp.]